MLVVLEFSTASLELSDLWSAIFICLLPFKFQGITFKRVGVPTATDIIKASSKDAMRCVWDSSSVVSSCLLQKSCLNYSLLSL